MIALLLRQEHRIRLTGRLVPSPNPARPVGQRTVGRMEDPEVIGARKRRCTRAVLTGLAVMAVALLLSSLRLAPDLLTTGAAIVGFSLVAYGVHLGWVIFYDRETDGPPA